MPADWNQWEGQVVAGFSLRKFLGSSFQSAVFLIDCAAPEPIQAAIKLTAADPPTADAQLARWQRVAKLSHPHLIRLLLSGRCELDGIPLLYVVMEFADENLSEILPQRALTSEEAGEMLPPVLEALAYIHENGFTHAAIKPSNIMAVGDQLKISSDHLTLIGERPFVASTRTAYDPPETARGVISPEGAMSPAGDIWSLGTTIVEALTQALPTDEWGASDDPQPPANLPQPFLDIARHSLRREAPRRWTVAQIVARLHPAARPVAPAKPSQPRPAPPPPNQPRGNGRYVLLVIAAALLAAIIGPRFLRHDARSAANSNAAPATIAEPSAGIPPSEQPAVAPTGATASVTRATPPQPPPAPATPVTAASSPKSSPIASTTTAPAVTSATDTSAILERVMPDFAPAAQKTIRGTVRIAIRVSVDPAGNVATATFDLRGPSGYFADGAMKAARKWKFAPIKNALGYVPVEWLLRFEVTPTATNVVADLANQ